MFLGFLNKIKANKIPPKLEAAIQHIRDDKYDEALLIAMENMSKEERVLYVAKFISGTHWRINSAALDIFNDTIDKFLHTGNTKILDNYLTQLSTEARTSNSSHSHIFYQVRADVINDLLHNNYTKSALSIVQTYRLEEMISQHQQGNDIKIRYKHTVIDVMSKVWPNKSMLKVLYG